MKTIKKSFMFLACFSLLLPLAAEKDYTKGFERFIKLGLPNVKDASYVKVSMHSNHGLVSNYTHSLFDLQLTGNAWLLKEDKTGISDFILGEVVEAGIYDSNYLRNIKRKEMRKKKKKRHGNNVFSMANDQRLAAYWHNASLKDDIKKVISYLDKKAAKSDKWQRRLYNQVIGKLFLFAVHVYQKGHKEEANKIAAGIFELSGSRRKVILLALNHLANGAYTSDYIKFRNDNYNWQAFLKPLDKLTERFKKGWHNKVAIKKLSELIEEQIDTKSIPNITGPNITPEQQEWAKKLVGLNNADFPKPYSYRRNRQNIWVLGTDKKTNEKGIINQIKDGGFKSVPFLIALLDDTYFTKVDLFTLKRSSRHYNFENRKKSVDELFNSINRPATRGDIARHLLSLVLLPQNKQYGSSRWWSKTTEEFKELSETWYDENKDKNVNQLALEYLETGIHGQKESAINFMVKNAANKRIPELEAYFLEVQSPLWKVEQVSRYVESAGTKAKPFVDEFINYLKESQKDRNVRYNSIKQQKRAEQQQAKQIKGAIAKLNMLVSADSGEDLLKQLTASPKEKGAKPAPKKETKQASKKEEKNGGKGFDQFIKLGLPDVSKAKYVKFQLQSHHALLSRYMNNFHELKMDGNAWLIKEGKDGVNDFIVGEVLELGIYDPETLQEIKQKEKTKDNAIIKAVYDNSDPRISGVWQDADLKDDIQAVIEYLDNKANETNEWRRKLYSHLTGKLFLFAVHIDQRGYKKEANEIAKKIISLNDSRRNVILIALNELADGLYNTDYFKLAQDGFNWQKYQEKMDVLVKRFKKGWRKKTAVEKLIKLVKERIKTKTVPAVTFKEITPEQQEWAEKLAVITQVSANPYGYNMFAGKQNLWILNDKSKDSKDDVIQQIKDGGFSSIPFLIALLDDNYLTKVNFATFKRNHMTYRFDHGQYPDVDEILNSMNRPATRGDIARLILSSLLFPQDNNNQFNPDWWKLGSEEFKEICESWYDDNKGKTKNQLALEYLKQGSDAQKTAAINYIIEHISDKRILELETYFLKMRNPIWKMNLISRYVGAIGVKGREFVKKFEKHLKDSLGKQRHYYQNADQKKRAEEQAAKKMERSIKLLNSLTTSETAADILKKLTDNKEKWNTEIRLLLLRKMARTTIDDAIKMVLGAVLATKDPDLKLSLLKLAEALPARNNSNTHATLFGMTKDQAEALDYPSPGKNKELWLKILNDKQTDFVTMGMESGNVMISTRAAVSYLSLYDKDFSMIKKRKLYNQLGKKAGLYWLACAKAMIAGKSIPAFPSVKTGNSKKLESELSTAEAGQVVTLFDSASLSDLLALKKNLNKNMTLKEKCSVLANEIIHAESKIDDPELKAMLAGMKGKRLSQDIVKSIFKAMQHVKSKENNSFYCLIKRDLFDGGTSIWLISSKDSRFYAYQKRGISGSIYIPNKMSVSTKWELPDNDAVEESDKKEKDQEADEDFAEAEDEMDEEMEEEVNREQKKFWKSIKKICSPEINPCSNAAITISIKK